MSRYARTGTTVRAHTSEASSANVTVRAKGRKNWLTKPPTKPSGRNTPTVVTVAAVIAPATSLRTVDRGSEAVFAHGAVSVDVLEHDDRVVDDASDGDREAAQGQDVQRDAGDLHDHERREQRSAGC